MKEWKQKIFTPKDFEGSGQYILREPKDKNPFISDTGYLSTIVKKVCYSQKIDNTFPYRYFLIDISDGLSTEGYFITKNSEGEKLDISQYIWVDFGADSSFESKLNICNYLNNNIYGETYRLATNEELIRIAAYQKFRTA